MREATQALTVLAELDPGPVPRALLEHRLAVIAGDLAGNPVFRPGELPDTHFMRFVIIDDPLKAKDAHSEVARENAVTWFKSTV